MHLPAKKSLGQNFLKSKAVVKDIITAADIRSGDMILEIGPGKGVLTESLLAKITASISSENKQGSTSGKLIAIEKDDRLVPLLQEQFSREIRSGVLDLLPGDILDANIENLANLGLKNGAYKIIANIPYYITGQLLRMFLESDFQPTTMVLMLQKEVAQRIVAHDKKESILSLSVKVYGKPKIVVKVPAKYFSPEPNVDSAVLLIDTISKDFFIKNFPSFSTVKEAENYFFELIKKGFSHKRKILASNLELSAENRALFFGPHGPLGQNEKIRAEDLTLEQWVILMQTLIQQKVKMT